MSSNSRGSSSGKSSHTKNKRGDAAMPAGGDATSVGDGLGMHHILALAYLLSNGARHGYVEMTTQDLGRGIRRSQQSASRYLADLERDGLVERATLAGTGGIRAAERAGTGPRNAAGRRMSIRVTRSGLEAVESLSSILQGGLAPASEEAAPQSIRLEGVLVSGMGEGAYYMSLEGYTRQFLSRVGYVPFPGTLNVRMSDARHVGTIQRLGSERAGIKIERFSDGTRTYGWAKCFPAILWTADACAGDNGCSRGESGSGDGDDGGGGNPRRSGGMSDTPVPGGAGSPSRPKRRRMGVPCELIVLERTHHDDSIVELISDINMRDAASIRDGSRVLVDVLPDDIGRSRR